MRSKDAITLFEGSGTIVYKWEDVNEDSSCGYVLCDLYTPSVVQVCGDFAVVTIVGSCGDEWEPIHVFDIPGVVNVKVAALRIKPVVRGPGKASIYLQTRR